ncbi:hypothetical protein EVAR_3991_1 [Eumeta japonica]|uniref:Uncharacterized protein n=1 Tax=Eumeta variegata TaxID=151549 RepID=A0A4C1T4I7_EUMVA|nr:hypothetical protein EVAR_3991_1 [Eumeta japonica]
MELTYNRIQAPPRAAHEPKTALRAASQATGSDDAAFRDYISNIRTATVALPLAGTVNYHHITTGLLQCIVTQRQYRKLSKPNLKLKIKDMNYTHTTYSEYRRYYQGTTNIE